MLTLPLGRSPRLLTVLAGMHSIGVASIWLLPLVLWLKLLVSLAVAVSLAFYGARDGWRVLGQSVVAVRLRSDCRCEIEMRRGPWREGRLLGSTYVTPYLTVLNLRLDGRVLARHVVILPDAVEGEGFRQLRVLLKWKCNASATAR